MVVTIRRVILKLSFVVFSLYFTVIINWLYSLNLLDNEHVRLVLVGDVAC